jgi:cytochrome P450
MLSQNEMTRPELVGMGAVMMDGGVETTSTFLQNFILSLINHPDIQAKGQQEIDAVVDPHRWPALTDYDKVP